MKKVIISLSVILGLGLIPCLEAEATSVSAETFNELYRLYNPNSGEHFFTENIEERNSLSDQGWDFEIDAGWITPKEGDPVYRLYNPNAGEHFYTRSVAEYNWLAEQGWNQEGISFFSSISDEAPVYRSYNMNATAAGSHMFTINKTEHDSLIQSGWINEGVQFYAVSPHTQLRAEIERYNSLKAEDYDATAFAKFKKAIDKAQSVLDNPNSTSQELLGQIATLVGASIELHGGYFPSTNT